MQSLMKCWTRWAVAACALFFVKMALAATPTPWVDLQVSNVRVAVRLANGDVQCASFDGISCAWNGTAQSATQQEAQLKPLACGSAHASIYKVTGYETSNHWCSVAYGRFYAQWLDAGIENSVFAYSVNPSGDVQCFSTDGRNCLWGTPASRVTPTNAAPLACGAMHKSLYGIDGYSNPSHWCALIRNKISSSPYSKFDPTRWYSKGDMVQAYSKLFRNCSGSSKGDWPGVGQACRSGNSWEDMGWVSGAPGNIPSWVSGQGYAMGDTVVYLGKVYATLGDKTQGSIQSTTPPNQPLYQTANWLEVGRL